MNRKRIRAWRDDTGAGRGLDAEEAQFAFSGARVGIEDSRSHVEYDRDTKRKLQSPNLGRRAERATRRRQFV